MALLVQKFGGSSVGTLERIKHVALKIVNAKKQGHDLVIVVSAMQGETDRLINLAQALTPEPNPREYDRLVSTGELTSMALLAMALEAMGCPARSYTGGQAGIITDTIHTKARIIDVQAEKVRADLAQGFVVIVAGFQGTNIHGDVTTLGRGGSDTTAVALAAALKADECQIYTDVDGVYTTDPNVLAEAQLLPQISFEEMLELSSLGAKVLQMRAVEFASLHNLPIRVLSSFNEGRGTLVTFDETRVKRLVSGVAFTRQEAIISLLQVPNNVGVEGHILGIISKADIEIDMIAQNAIDQLTTDITFTVSRSNFAKTLALTQGLAKELGAVAVKSNAKAAKLSLVGLGMKSHAGVASTMCKALGHDNINIMMITTSEIKISVVIDEIYLEKAVKAVHNAFNLHKSPIEEKSLHLEA